MSFEDLLSAFFLLPLELELHLLTFITNYYANQIYTIVLMPILCLFDTLTDFFCEQSSEKSTTMFRMFSWTKNVHTITERSLQQDQKSHCAMSKEYEQKCRLDQVKLNIDTCEKTDKDTECNELFSCSSDPQEYTNTPSVTCINSLGQNSTQQVYVSIQKGEVEVDTLRTGRTPFDHVKHTSGRHNQLEEQCKCSVCNKYFSNIKDHRLHMRTHTDENPYECNMCSKSLTSNQTCQIHMDKKPYKCIICSKSFTLNSTRKKHMRTHTGEKPYNCSLCNKSFSQNTGRQIHMMTHTGEKPYKCNVCNGTFYDSSGRRAHMRTHTGEKPFKCSFCGKSFKQYASRMVHMRTHTGEKPYKCNICSKSFTQNSTHKQHMRTHTGEKPYNCSVCNKSFSQNAGRQIHMVTHTGEKPYKCTVCSKSFVKSTTLKEHMRTHTGERPYGCSVCNKSFRRLSNLRVHMRTHSGPYKCTPMTNAPTSKG
uniref:C2H2-type domain-containing protein n=1 Tax=Eptatretus burgeri TaxID=7764 RepID=A0A8C4X2D2_EPTBU